jgi:hypothetical protein
MAPTLKRVAAGFAILMLVLLAGRRPSSEAEDRSTNKTGNQEGSEHPPRDASWPGLVAGLVVGLILLWLFLAIPGWMRDKANGRCSESAALGAAQPAPSKAPPSLVLRPGQSNTLALGRSLGLKSRQLEFEPKGGTNVLSQGLNWP